MAVPVRNGADFLAALDAPDAHHAGGAQRVPGPPFPRGPRQRPAPRRSPGVARVSGRTLFLIPARGGSKRIPGKNLRSLAGIPLVAWAGRIARGGRRSPGDVDRLLDRGPGDRDRAPRPGALRVLDRPDASSPPTPRPRSRSRSMPSTPRPSTASRSTSSPSSSRPRR